MADSKQPPAATGGAGAGAGGGAPLVIGSMALSAEQELKRKQMLDKFEASHKAVTALSGVAANSAASVADAERAKAFRATLDSTRASVKAGLEAAAAVDTAALAGHFKALSDGVAAAEASLARTVQVLTASEQRSASTALKELAAAVAAERAKRMPIKKTAFGSKAKAAAAAAAAAATAAATTTPTAAVAVATATAPSAAAAPAASATGPAPATSAAPPPPSSSSSSAADAELAALLRGADARTVRFDNRHDEVLVVDASTVAALGGGRPDIWLRNCRGCTLWVSVVTSAVRIDHVRDCRFWVAPVAGSVHIEHADACTFAVASRQLRIHTTYDTAFAVRTRSGPIVEHCARVTFEPYNVAYPALHAHFVEADLMPATAATATAATPSSAASTAAAASSSSSDATDAYNLWSDVKDFQWLREGVASPNWSIQPPDKRLPVQTPPAVAAAAAVAATTAAAAVAKS